MVYRKFLEYYRGVDLCFNLTLFCEATTKFGGPHTLTTELLESSDARSPFTAAAIASDTPIAKLGSSIQTLTPLTYILPC